MEGALKEAILEHLKIALFFAGIGAIITYFAYRLGFFRLKPHFFFPVTIKGAPLGAALYICLFFLSPLLVLYFLKIHGTEVKERMPSPIEVVTLSQLISIGVIAVFLAFFSLMQPRSTNQMIWQGGHPFSSYLPWQKLKCGHFELDSRLPHCSFYQPSHNTFKRSCIWSDRS